MVIYPVFGRDQVFQYFALWLSPLVKKIFHLAEEACVAAAGVSVRGGFWRLEKGYAAVRDI
jgi:hypothetical protein